MQQNKETYQRKPSMYQQKHSERSRYRTPENRSTNTVSLQNSSQHRPKPIPNNSAQPVSHIQPDTPAFLVSSISDVGPTIPTTSLEQRQKKLLGKQRRGQLKSGIGLVGFILAALGFALLINRFILQSYQVIGSSMSPTLEENDWLVISKLGKSINREDYLPSRGDVIVFTHPSIGQDKSLIKRVIALPGERVEVNETGLRVYNDKEPNGFDPDIDYREDIDLPDPDNYKNYASSLANGPLTVPDGHVFVAGDNRSPGDSLDSRNSLGTVPAQNITGALKVRLFPASEIDFSF